MPEDTTAGVVDSVGSVSFDSLISTGACILSINDNGPVLKPIAGRNLVFHLTENKVLFFVSLEMI